MTTRLYKRTARVLAYRLAAGLPGGFVYNNPQAFSLPNATEIKDLAISFKIEKSLDSEPNRCEVVIRNCSELERVNLTKKPLMIQLDAGYDDNQRRIFLGNLRFGYSDLDDDGTWETNLQLADGDGAWRYARVNRAYKKGIPVTTVLQDAAKTMGLTIDASTLASNELQSQIASGITLYGPTRDELTRLLAPFGYNWSIQDGKMQILRDEDTRSDQARIISEDTGMVYSPQWQVPEKDGQAAMLHVKCLLYPELTPGARIQVSSRDVNGMFRIEKVTHTGDTHGDDWLSEIEAKPNP